MIELQNTQSDLRYIHDLIYLIICDLIYLIIIAL